MTAITSWLARWRHNPAARTKFREQLRMEDGRSCGEAWVDYQRETFALWDRHPEKHTYTERGRGGSKTTDLAAEVICELFLRPKARIDAVAADRDQAALLHAAVVGFLERTEGLMAAAKVERWSVEVPALRSRLEVLAADAASAYGRTPTMLAVDEFAEWTEGAAPFWYAIWSAVPKVRARVHIISSPGLGRSGFAWNMREVARTSDRWVFTQQVTPPPWMSAEWIREQQDTLPPDQFERLFGGVWTQPGSSFLQPAEVERTFTLHLMLPSKGAVAVGGDLALSRDSAVLCAVAMAKRSRFTVLEFATFRPTKHEPVDLVEVRETLRAMLRRYDASVGVLDPYQGELLKAELVRDRLPVATYPFTHESRMELFMTLFRAIRTGQLQSAPHESFRNELLNLQVAQTPSGAMRVDHRLGRHDDHVVAAALAIHWLSVAAQRYVPLVGAGGGPGRVYYDELDRPLYLQGGG